MNTPHLTSTHSMNYSQPAMDSPVVSHPFQPQSQSMDRTLALLRAVSNDTSTTSARIQPRVSFTNESLRVLVNEALSIKPEAIQECQVCLSPIDQEMSVYSPQCHHPIHVKCYAGWAAINAKQQYATLKDKLDVSCPSCRHTADFKNNKTTQRFYKDVSSMVAIAEEAKVFKTYFKEAVALAQKKGSDGQYQYISGRSGILSRSFWDNLNGLEELTQFLNKSLKRIISITNHIESSEAQRGPLSLPASADIDALVKSLDQLYIEIDQTIPYALNILPDGTVDGLLDNGERRRVRISDLQRLDDIFTHKIHTVDWGTLLAFYIENDPSGFEVISADSAKRSLEDDHVDHAITTKRQKRENV